MDALLDAQRKGQVLGLKGLSPNNPVTRLDIDELFDKTGYFQIAGIHGLPNADWDGVSNPRSQRKGGYCAHGRPVFPIWHRPYLAMYEQTLYCKMAEIAERYPENAKLKYRTGLKQFRLPYWDYYRPRGKNAKFNGITSPDGTTNFPYDFSVPQIFTVASVRVRRTSDDQIGTINNPLSGFVFPQNGSLSANDWATAAWTGQGQPPNQFSQKQTCRFPDVGYGIQSNIANMNSTINDAREGNMNLLLSMLTTKAYNSWVVFSSTALTRGASGNLESVHNDYHWLIGGNNGHMSDPRVAAFDPIFWIHHCNIDRWLAIWQAVHPNVWFDGTYLEGPQGKEVERSVKSLAEEYSLPFRYPSGSPPMWNANLSRDTKAFGYFYKDATGPADAVKNRISEIYGWMVRNKLNKIGTIHKDMDIIPVVDAQAFTGKAAPEAIKNMASKAMVAAPQVLMNAVQATAHTLSSSAGLSLKRFHFTSKLAQGVTTKPILPRNSISRVAFTNLVPSSSPAPQAVDEAKYTRNWYVDSVVERLALNGSFTIIYFIGDFEQGNAANLVHQPTTAGFNHIFAASREACDNCGQQLEDGHQVTSTNDVTPILLDYIKIGVLPNLESVNIVPFLIANLKWRVIRAGGETVNPRTVAGLHFGVSCKLTPMTPNGGDDLYEEYPQVIEQILAQAS